MNPLFNKTLLSCLLLLTACSSQNQTTAGQNLPIGANVAQPEVLAKEKSAEPAAKNEKPSAVGIVLPNKKEIKRARYEIVSETDLLSDSRGAHQNSNAASAI